MIHVADDVIHEIGEKIIIFGTIFTMKDQT